MIEVFVDEELKIISAKQELFLLFGNPTTQTIKTFLFNEDILKIKSLLKTNDSQMISKFKSTYCVKDVLIKKSPEVVIVDGKNVYKLYIIVISDIFNDYLDNETKITNLSIACSLANITVFEYFKDDDFLKISNGSDEILYTGELDGLLSKTDDSYYNDLYHALIQEQETIDITNNGYKIVSNSYILDYKKHIIGIITKENSGSYDTNKFDYSTGLYTKSALLKYINQVNNGTIIMIEIDFPYNISKKVQNKYFDVYKKKLANLIKDLIKGYGVGGLDNEQFIIYLKTIDEVVIRSICESLRTGVQSATQASRVPVTVSIGLARMTVDANNIKDVYNLAAKALFIAKTKGKNRYIIYRDSMHRNVSVEEVKLDLKSSFVQMYNCLASGKTMEEKFDNVMKLLKNLIGFDQINVYINNELKCYFGEKTEFKGILNEKSLKFFGKEEILIICNTLPISPINEIASELFEKQGVLSVIQVLIKNEDKMLGYISFEHKKERKSYSQNEIILITTAIELVKEYLI